MEHMPPVRTTEIRHSDGWVPGIDPNVAVEMMVAEAECMRVQAELARVGNDCQEHDSPMRDLSPLGR
jgi:hypothetical protein